MSGGDPGSAYLRAGLEATRAVAAATAPTVAYKAVLPILGPRLDCALARLWLREPGGRELVCVDWWWSGPRFAEMAPSPFGVTCSPGVGLAGRCWASGAALAVGIEDADDLFPNQAGLAASGIRTALAAPLAGRHAVLGVLTPYFTTDRMPEDGHLSALVLLGETLGAAIEAKQRESAAHEELRRNRVVLDAASAVAGAGGYEDTLRMLAVSSVPGLADLCLIDLLTLEGSLRRVAAVHADPAKAPLVEELLARYAPETASAHPAGQVVASGRSMWSPQMPEGFLEATTRDERHLEVVRALGFESYMSVPLAAGGQVLGAVTLISAGSGRVFTEADLATGEQLAAQVAGTVARALDLEERQKQAVEQAARSAALVELGTALGAARTIEETLEAVLASPRCSLGATHVRVGLLDEGRRTLRVRFGGAFPAEARERFHRVAVDGPTPMAAAVRTNERSAVSDIRKGDPRYRTESADPVTGLRADLVQPLRAEDGTVLGALALSWPHPREFAPAELELASSVAVALSRSVARIVVAEREHQISTQLQERLLTLDMRSTDVVLAAAYLPSGEALRVGGDWYTVSLLDGERRVGVSVGDVVGHGLPAVTTMSQLRSALGAAALSTADPGELLSLVDRYAATVPEAICATVAYALVDVAAGTVEYACAGHPYPFLVTGEGEVKWLRDGRRPPLATASPGTRPPPGQSAFAAGSLLVLYSDGLIERRGESLQAGLDRLGEVARRCRWLPVEAVCAELAHAMSDSGSYRDDVAIVALRPVGTTSASHVDAIPSQVNRLAFLRARLRAWLQSLGLGPETQNRVLLATGEAVNNAVEHGSAGDARRAVGLEGFVVEEALTITISDAGDWTGDSAVSRRDNQRGHGLKIIHGLSDEVRTVRSMMGTHVSMTFKLAAGDHAQPGSPGASGFG